MVCSVVVRGLIYLAETSYLMQSKETTVCVLQIKLWSLKKEISAPHYKSPYEIVAYSGRKDFQQQINLIIESLFSNSKTELRLQWFSIFSLSHDGGFLKLAVKNTIKKKKETLISDWLSGWHFNHKVAMCFKAINLFRKQMLAYAKIQMIPCSCVANLLKNGRWASQYSKLFFTLSWSLRVTDTCSWFSSSLRWYEPRMGGTGT